MTYHHAGLPTDVRQPDRKGEVRDTTIAERVRRGAELLDRERPGWVDEIDVDTLTLENPCRCVLGQLFGGWEDGYDGLGLTQNPLAPGASAVLLGFDLSRAEPTSRYPDLTDAWRRLIRERRAVVPTAAAGDADRGQ